MLRPRSRHSWTTRHPPAAAAPAARDRCWLTLLRSSPLLAALVVRDRGLESRLVGRAGAHSGVGWANSVLAFCILFFPGHADCAAPVTKTSRWYGTCGLLAVASTVTCLPPCITASEVRQSGNSQGQCQLGQELPVRYRMVSPRSYWCAERSGVVEWRDELWGVHLRLLLLFVSLLRIDSD
jgi:hypothetical protein